MELISRFQPMTGGYFIEKGRSEILFKWKKWLAATNVFLQQKLTNVLISNLAAHCPGRKTLITVSPIMAPNST